MSDLPAYLPSGTEVSAKFKGAFCEAKVKKVVRSVRIKITLKEAPFGNIYLEDGAIPSTAKIELNEAIEVVHNGHTVKGVIVLIKDCSKYQVVFNDGDEKELRRTQLCLKSGKHFDTAVNLDALPLYNPEQFSSPVVRGVVGKSKSHKKRRSDESSNSKRKKKQDEDSEDEEDEESDDEILKKRERRAAASAATVAIGEMDQGDTHSDASSTASSDGMDYETEEDERARRRDELMERDREEKQRKLMEERKIKMEAEKMRERERLQKEKEKMLKEKLKEKEKLTDRPKVVLSPEIKRQYHLDQEALGFAKCVIVFEDLQSASRIRDSIATAAAESMIAAMTGHAVPYNPPVASASAFPGPSNAVQRLTIPNQVYPFFYKRQWWPAVIVSTLAYHQYGNRSKNPEKNELTIRRFSDGKYLTRAMTQLVPFAWMPLFSKKKMEEFKDTRSDGSNSKDKYEFTVALAMAYTFNDTGKLPKGWMMKELLGKQEEDSSDYPSTSSSKDVKKVEEKKTPAKPNAANSSESEISSDESDNAVSSEERDLFIAKLYKFHEDSASPINRVPVLGGREIDMYLFFKLIQKYGGAKRVTTNNKWTRILARLKLHGCPGANAVTLRKSYARYLEPYCNFEAKLGWSFDGKAAELSGSSSRVERRLVRPGQLTELEKKKKPKLEEKTSSSKISNKDREDAKHVRDSKEGSVVDSIISTRSRSVKSESPVFPAINIDRFEGLRTRRSTSIESSEKSLDLKKLTKDKINDTVKRELKREYSATKDTDRGREKLTFTLSDGSKKEKFMKLEEPSDYGDEVPKKKEMKKTPKPKPAKKPTPNANADKTLGKDKPEENYVPANFISHFYLGQKVKAIHSGAWYNGRVLEFTQPKYSDIIEILLKGNDPQAIPEDSLDKIKTMSGKIKILVHYLGWNARYDEWIQLHELQVSDKDQQSSRISLREQPNGKLVPDYRIALAEVCTSSAHGNKKIDFAEILKNVKESSSKLSRAGYTQMPSSSSASSSSSMMPVTAPSTSYVREKQETNLSVPSTSTPSLPKNVSPASGRTLLVKTAFSPMTSLQSMTDSAISSALRTTPSGLPKFSLTSFMSHMKSNADPKLTVRAVAAAAVGLEARSRGSRLLLSPPGGRSQKTLLHQLSSEAGYQALRSDPSSRLDAEKREQALAHAAKMSQPCTLSTKPVPTPPTVKRDMFPVATIERVNQIRTVMPNFTSQQQRLESIGKPELVKRPTPPSEKESLRKSRAAVKQAEDESMTKMIEGLIEDPRKMMQGVMMAAEQKQEAQNRSIKNAVPVPLNEFKVTEEVAKPKEAEKAPQEPPVVTLLNDVKKELIERTGQDRFIGDYDITRKSSRKSTIAASTASINAQKVPTFPMTPPPPLVVLNPKPPFEKIDIPSTSSPQQKHTAQIIVTPPTVVAEIVQEKVIERKEVEKKLEKESVITAVEEPIAEKSIVEKPTVEEPIVKEPVVKEPVVEKPVVEKAVVETPVIEKPVVEKPLVEKPFVEKTVAEKSVAEKPPVEKPVVEKPVVEKHVVEKPIVEKPLEVITAPAEPIAVEIEPDDEIPIVQPTKPSSKSVSPQVLKPIQKKKQPIRQAVIAAEDKKKSQRLQENIRKKETSDDEDYSEFFSNQKTDTFNQMKSRMQKQMEQKNIATDFSLLGLPDFDKLVAETPEKDLMDVLEQRCQELRDIYHSSKANLVTLERGKKKFMEQKRYRERKQRLQSPSMRSGFVDQPSTSSASSSSSSCKPSTSTMYFNEYEPEL